MWGGRTYTNPPGCVVAGYVVAGAAMAYAATAYAATARAAGEGLGSRGASEIILFTAKALRSFLCENKQVFWWVSRISALYLNVHNLLQRLLRGLRLPRLCFRRKKMAASRKTFDQLGKCRCCSE